MRQVMFKLMERLGGMEGLLVIVLVLMFVVVVADFMTAEPYLISGIVVGKEFSPAHIETRYRSIGGVTRSVSYQVDDEWRLIIRNDVEIDSFSVHQDIYYSIEIGDVVNLKCAKGGITGIVDCRRARRR